MPLPPYIKEKLQDKERYQTVYSRELGSAAAPTAGLPFTKEILAKLKERGVNIAYVTLHVGLGTFRPVKVDDVTEHKMHSEHYSITQENADIINNTKQNGGRVICVGTTSCRTVESAMQKFGEIKECSDDTSLILGENGTGKDLVARSLRFFSPRQQAPFITIDLGSVPETLFESELFGYEKGAFTDARKAKAGRMEVASGGTLFLDEIGNLSLAMQSKLLTAIEKRRISRLGSTKSQPIDVRLICATNSDIRQMVEEGNFRQDLLYRINTIEIRIPPLRERGNDIILLADHFLQKYAHKYKKEILGLTREAKQKLMKYEWPGNVRELQHAMERAVILSQNAWMRPNDFMLTPVVEKNDAVKEILNLEELEAHAVKRAMKLCAGNISSASELLGITRYQLYRKIEKLGL